MEHDQRDRRDSPDAEDASTLPPDSTQPSPESTGSADETAAAGGETSQTSIPDEPDHADEPPSWEAQAAPPEAEAPAAKAPDAPAESAEMESWPSQDAPAESAAQPTEAPASGSADTEAWPAEPPAESASWPTEPPAAGSADTDTWPTSPPERGDEPIREPEWGDTAAPADSTAAEPPPPEVEAYPAAAEGAETAAAAGMAAHSVPAAESATGESTQCPRCGTENRPGLAFCRNCGQRLVAAGVASTVERPGTPEGTMACPRCGTHNRAGVAFCQNCGANLRGTAAGYVPPAVAVGAEAAASVETRRGGAVLGPVVLLIGLVGIVTGYVLPFLYGSGSLFDRAFGGDGYGVAFWSGYPDVGAGLADQAYFGLTGPIPLLGLILLALAIGGFARAKPGPLQTVGLGIALLWSVGLIVLFLVVELAGNWDGDLVGMLRVLTPAGIIFFLSSLIILIGTLTRFGRS